MNYKWVKTNVFVRRNADGACIPNDPANVDWQRFQDDGGTADPEDPPPTPDPRIVLDAEECSQAKIDAQVQTFLNMTPAQLDAWCDANLPVGGTRTMGKVLGRLAQNAARGQKLR